MAMSTDGAVPVGQVAIVGVTGKEWTLPQTPHSRASLLAEGCLLSPNVICFYSEQSRLPGGGWQGKPWP
jgi:hypothetical protein